jgi:hypothetical protein
VFNVQSSGVGFPGVDFVKSSSGVLDGTWLENSPFMKGEIHQEIPQVVDSYMSIHVNILNFNGSRML